MLSVVMLSVAILIDNLSFIMQSAVMMNVVRLGLDKLGKPRQNQASQARYSSNFNFQNVIFLLVRLGKELLKMNLEWNNTI